MPLGEFWPSIIIGIPILTHFKDFFEGEAGIKKVLFILFNNNLIYGYY